MSKHTIKLFNTQINNVSMNEAIEQIEDLIQSGRSTYVVTPNVDHIVKIDEDPLFYEVYKNADLVLADGVPVIWASKLLNKPIKEKVSGADLFPRLCEYAAKMGYKIFLLGAEVGVAANAVKVLEQRYEGIRIVGSYSPPYGFEKDEKENNKIIDMLRKAKPDILFVGLGAPKQEVWIYKNKDKYQVPVSLGIGAAIDFIAGNVRRAPMWMQKSGLEWFYRFLQEPRRLFKRYFIDDFKFIKIFIKEYKKSSS